MPDLHTIKKFLPAIAFFAGFLWDSLTLTRIDRLIDNVILLAYLLILGILIILLNLIESGSPVKLHPLLTRYKKWYPFAVQFLLGGLFSAYVVFYFKSASLTKASVFFVVLMAFLVVNEFLEQRYTNIYLQVALYFLVNVSFFIFFIPVIFRHIGLLSFLIGGIVSLLTVEGLIYYLNRKSVFTSPRMCTITGSIPPVLFGLLLIFYLMNWIPPVPLSITFSGIYHDVIKKTGDGRTTYALAFEKPLWYKPWKSSDNPFRHSGGDRVYCFTAVFASTDLETSIYHHWQRYSAPEDRWITSDRIPVDITGGRDEGYRVYTYKEHIEPGAWRVDVKSENDLIVGRVNFSIVRADEHEVSLTTIVR